MRALELRKALTIFARSLTSEEDIIELSGLYPTWEELVSRGIQCKAKSIFRYGLTSVGDEQLWEFISDYVPVDTYTPDQDITHYKKIGITDDGIAMWVQPYGGTDAYRLNDIVYYDGKYYKSNHNSNVWIPSTVGSDIWELIAKPGTPPEVPTEMNSNGTAVWSEWVPWDNYPETLYKTGDRVTKDTIRYISTLDSNHWDPTSGTGWTVYTE